MPPTTIVTDGNHVIAPEVTRNGSNGIKPSQSSVLHRSLHNNPMQVVRASGDYLELSTGQKILDATGGAAVSCLGHGNERVARAVARQMASFSYCHSLLFSSSSSEELARLLCESTNGHMTKAFVVSSGSEAMEAALKLARQYFLEQENPQPKRTNFISRRESYHGTTLGALAAGGHVARRALFEPLLSTNTSRVSPCNEYRGAGDGEAPEQYVTRLAEELDLEFQRVGADTVCAFIAEPVVGAALGCVPPVKGYFKAMKAVCEKHGALLILDEVMSGMGRTGTLHAWEQEDVVPDIQTIGKGLGGGYAAIGGLLINRKVVDALDRGTGAFMHGQTYQGHPVACAAALEVQKIIQDQNLLANVRTMGKLMSALLIAKLQDHPHVGNIRGRGLFWGIEFVKDKATKEPFDPRVGVAMGVHEKALEPKYSISLYPGTGTADGKNGDHVLVAPAYNVTEDQITNIVKLTVAAIEEYFRELEA